MRLTEKGSGPPGTFHVSVVNFGFDPYRSGVGSGTGKGDFIGVCRGSEVMLAGRMESGDQLGSVGLIFSLGRFAQTGNPKIGPCSHPIVEGADA